MDVANMTLLEFMAGQTKGHGCQPLNPWPALRASLNETAWILGTEVSIVGRPEFATAVANRAGRSPMDVVLLVRDQEANWRPIGGYVDTIVAIDDGFCGQGLSADLVLRASAERPIPTVRQFTVSGYRALARAHRIAVERAVADGQKLRQEVLKDYPDLAKIAESSAGASR